MGSAQKRARAGGLHQSWFPPPSSWPRGAFNPGTALTFLRPLTQASFFFLIYVIFAV